MEVMKYELNTFQEYLNQAAVQFQGLLPDQMEKVKISEKYILNFSCRKESKLICYLKMILNEVLDCPNMF